MSRSAAKPAIAAVIAPITICRKSSADRSSGTY
jgi:hypothetical protein